MDDLGEQNTILQMKPRSTIEEEVPTDKVAAQAQRKIERLLQDNQKERTNGAVPPHNGGGSNWNGEPPPHNGGGSNWNGAESLHNGGVSSWNGAVPPHDGGVSSWSRAVPLHDGGGSNWNGAPPPHNGGGSNWSGAPPPHNGGISSWNGAESLHNGGISSWSRAATPYNGGVSSWNGAELPHNGGISIWNGAAPPVGYHSPNFSIQRPNFLRFLVQPNPNTQFQRPQPPKGSSNLSEIVQKVDKAAKKARRDLIDAGENVSTWKVSQAALAIVKADSWESLGVQMQRVPSLNSLILIQGKIAAFIHCFVAVLKVTTLYDLEVAICKNEGVGKFEELELGPLLKHPLIVHYFSVNPGVSEVFKITSEEIMSFVSEFMDRNGGTAVKIDELLNFIAEKKSAGSRENLGVRIQSLGMHITFIQQARQFETSAMNKYMHTEKKESSKIIRKHPILSAQKKQLDKNFISASSNSEDASSDDDQDETENIKSSEEPHICMPFGLKAEVEELDQNFISISERITSFSSANGKFCGKHIRFISSDSEDASSDGDQDKTGNIKSSERPSTCPYPSASEEMARLGLETEVNSSLHTASGSDGYRNDIRQTGNIKSSERPSICPYPPASEEKMQLGLETEISGSLRTASGSDGCRKDIGLSEIDSNFLVLAGKIKRNIKPSKRKRKFDDVQSPVVSNKVVKRKVVRTKPFTRRMGTKISPLRNQASNGSCNFSQGDDSIKMFVNTWKEACRTNNVYEFRFLKGCLSSIRRRRRKLK
ncbi:uncharacterized protein LOC107865622 [Capsicum annuum]|uniref:uncharacterized protein LOC107865622 n=1 Tax=Capsicum annuum TaxID=4072 RepID=UPI001FB084D6|nr:uncharacterized protein LOC107865622 [Capsicum annuum]